MRYYTMIGIARGFPPCFHMLAINFIGNREILYIFISSNHGSSSVKYSRHNIQQNRQTKKKKKLNYTLHFCVLFRFMVSTFVFLPCDAMLARYMLSSSLRPSVTSRYCIETSGLIELVFGTVASFHLSHTLLQGYLCISKNYGTSGWNFVPDFPLETLSPRQVDRVVNNNQRRRRRRSSLFLLKLLIPSKTV